MSEAKCPMCGGNLIQSEEFPYFYSCQTTNWKSDADKLCELDDCAASVPVWETLRRTRKALDILLFTINRLENQNYKDCAWHLRLAIAKIEAMDIANKALEQIKTALTKGGDNE